MRIVGGIKKGQRLKVAHRGIRPTKSIVREAIFNIIRERVQEAKILDIFAGSGALGIESLSRGAAHCVFIEKHPKTLRENLSKMRLTDHAEIINSDYRTGLARLKKRSFDLIFLDPPYQKGYLENTLQLITAHGLLEPDGMIIAEHSSKKKITVPDMISTFKRKQYGETSITLFVKTNHGKGEAQ
jgi:16S rRNA (guanine966-N2)-methyltransferase